LKQVLSSPESKNICNRSTQNQNAKSHMLAQNLIQYGSYLLSNMALESLGERIIYQISHNGE